MRKTTLLHTLTIFLMLFLPNISRSKNVSYNYSYLNDTFTFQTLNKSLINPPILDYSELFSKDNILLEYYSTAKSNKFKIEYYNVPFFSFPKILIKAYFNSKKVGTVTEILEDVSQNSYFENTNKVVFPKKYYDFFEITQNRYASNEGRKKTKKKIYNTFGFDIKSKLKYKIEKILLVNYRKEKVNYLANLTPYLNEDNKKEKNKEINTISYDFHLENLPEDFDIFLTLIIDNSNEKILLVQKKFNYPNYKVESVNPNKNFFKISLIITLVALAFTFISSILILIINC